VFRVYHFATCSKASLDSNQNIDETVYMTITF